MLKGKSFLHEVNKNKILILMILPAIIYYFIFSYLPMAGIVVAFKSFSYSKGIFGSPWVGLDNFRFFFITGDAYTVTRNTVLYNLIFIISNTFLQITVAIILSEIVGKWFRKITQSLMFLPYFLSWVIVGAFVYNLFNYNFGAFNSFLKFLGMQPVDVYSNVGAWKYIIVFFKLWKDVGYGSVIYLAAIMGIDQEMYEAADIDGASVMQKIGRITFPCLVPTMIMLILLSIGSIFRGDFQMFYNITSNSPLLYKSTDVIDTYVFRSLTQTQEFGMSAATGLYQSVLCFITIITVNQIVRKVDKDSALF